MIEMCFERIFDLPIRTQKPRKLGITGLSENIYDLESVKALIDWCGPWLDYVNMRWSLLQQPRDLVRKKIQAFREGGVVFIFPENFLFEIAICQGKLNEYLNECKDMGFNGIEISNMFIPQVSPPRKVTDDLIGLIEKVKKVGFQVFFEYGEKFPQSELPLNESVDAIRKLLKNGIYQVTIEYSEIAKLLGDLPHDEHGRISDFYGDNRGEVLIKLVNEIGMENLLLEAGIKQSEYVPWLIRTFGPEVNLMILNGADEIQMIEDMRRGLHRQSGFSFLQGKCDPSLKRL